eukprot:CAMPEP_0119265190 /NCGR_PEP_ID=MMETSP1329-20130426/4072_1 /TAXON_ID=114041 /ORGANISM="Genus nov. species nov., Strain RCC1024" /LENGTH=114 /DNA_ID=CAMNT_0007265001 /DNA_START=20 /DNA_END=364 /DNA_ORIENTATION=-
MASNDLNSTSAMLEAKQTRVRAEADMKLLENRLRHLQFAERKAREKIAETQGRTSEIVRMKKRNKESKALAASRVENRVEPSRRERSPEAGRGRLRPAQSCMLPLDARRGSPPP